MNSHIIPVLIDPSQEPRQESKPVGKTKKEKHGEKDDKKQLKDDKFYLCCGDLSKCHYERFFKWIVFRNLNDPDLCDASRGAWRYALYADYFLQANYVRYRYCLHNGLTDYPYNATE